MIFNAPQIAQGGPARVLVLEQSMEIMLQVTGAATIFLGTSKDEAGRTAVGAQQDGLQFNAANADRPYRMYWKGEMWAAGSDPQSFFVVIVPGLAQAMAKGDACISAEEMTAEY
jgi:hypothetical protein